MTESPNSSLYKAVISGVGPDRPGIVSALGQILMNRGCNIVDSTMTRLSEEFAMILIVTCPENLALERLEQDLIRLENQMDLTFSVKPASETPPGPKQERNLYMVSVTGQDRTGLTFRVAQYLADKGINITDLNAHVMDGEDGPVYLMMVEVDIPPATATQTLEADLDRLAGELGVEIQLRPLETVAL